MCVPDANAADPVDRDRVSIEDVFRQFGTVFGTVGTLSERAHWLGLDGEVRDLSRGVP